MDKLSVTFGADIPVNDKHTILAPSNTVAVTGSIGGGGGAAACTFTTATAASLPNTLTVEEEMALYGAVTYEFDGGFFAGASIGYRSEAIQLTGFSQDAFAAQAQTTEGTPIDKTVAAKTAFEGDKYDDGTVTYGLTAGATGSISDSIGYYINGTYSWFTFSPKTVNASTDATSGDVDGHQSSVSLGASFAF